MKKFEYKEAISDLGTVPEFWLNEYGQEGWEVCNIHYQAIIEPVTALTTGSSFPSRYRAIVILKREITNA